MLNCGPMRSNADKDYCSSNQHPTIGEGDNCGTVRDAALDGHENDSSGKETFTEKGSEAPGESIDRNRIVPGHTLDEPGHTIRSTCDGSSCQPITPPNKSSDKEGVTNEEVEDNGKMRRARRLLAADYDEEDIEDSQREKDITNAIPFSTKTHQAQTRQARKLKETLEKVNLCSDTVELCDELSQFLELPMEEVIEKVSVLLNTTSTDAMFMDRDVPDGYLNAVRDGEEGTFWEESWIDEKSKLIKYKTLDFDSPVTMDEAKAAGTEILESEVQWKRKTATNPKTLETIITKRKARLCAKEFAGERGKKTFVPMVSETAFRIILAFGFQNGFFICTGDYESAFLHGEYPYDSLLRMPRGLRKFDEENRELLYRLLGNLYGTTTGGQIFFTTNDNHLIKIGFVAFKSERAVYAITHPKIGKMIVMYHVDDFISLSKTMEGQEWFFMKLREKFTVSGPDPATMFCGSNIVITNKLLVIHGIPWIKARLKEYGMLDEDGNVDKTIRTNVPWKGEAPDPNSPLLVGEEKAKAMNMKGCGIWMSYKFRPDCQPGCMASCRFMANPTQQSLGWIVDVWKYAANNLHWVLAVKKDPSRNSLAVVMKIRETDAGDIDQLWEAAEANVYTDSNWSLPRSITGTAIFAFGMLVESGGALQSTTADSTTFAEIIGMHSGTKKGVWGRRFIMELLGITEEHLKRLGKTLAIPIYGDNIGALKFGREQCVSSKLRHVPAAYYYCYEMSEDGQVTFHQIPSEMNWADYWTKAHGAAKVDKHRSIWMVHIGPGSEWADLIDPG